MNERLFKLSYFLTSSTLAVGVLMLLYVALGCGGSELNLPEAIDDNYGDSFEETIEDLQNQNYKFVSDIDKYWELDVLNNDILGEDSAGAAYLASITKVNLEGTKGMVEIDTVNQIIKYTEYVPGPGETWDGIDEFTYDVVFSSESDGEDNQMQPATVRIDTSFLSEDQTEFPSGRTTDPSLLVAPSIISSISTFNSQTIGLSASTAPMNFAVAHSDRRVDLDSLIVEVRSDNQDVIKDENIEVDTTDPTQCSVIVKHEGDNVGQARIKVSVRDPFGVSSSVSFLVSVQYQSSN